MIKQELYNAFISELKIQDILLKQRSFRLTHGFRQNTQNQVNISHKLVAYKHKDQNLSVDFKYEVVCTREDKTVWKSEYTYQVLMCFANPETISSVISDNELRELFENAQLNKFLWSYLRQELQSDTLKAGIPGFILPPRK